MTPQERDAAYLWDMLDAAKTVMSFIEDINYHDYEKDKKLQMAVERGIEIIGEAANHVSESFQKEHPEILWRAIIGQRNVLAHDYGDIRQDRIWAVATEKIKELVDQLMALGVDQE